MTVSKTVEDNLSDKDFSVSVFAAKMGVSKKYLYDILRKYWKTTPSVYIREERLRVARNLLETSSLTVSEISERVGFSSPSYFVSVFRKETGTTPLNYKQKRK